MLLRCICLTLVNDCGRSSSMRLDEYALSWRGLGLVQMCRLAHVHCVWPVIDRTMDRSRRKKIQPVRRAVRPLFRSLGLRLLLVLVFMFLQPKRRGREYRKPTMLPNPALPHYCSPPPLGPSNNMDESFYSALEFIETLVASSPRLEIPRSVHAELLFLQQSMNA